MEIKKAIEIITKYHLNKYEHDKAYENTKKYDTSINAFKLAIAALEGQEKEPCESCEYWKCVDAKYCPECGRKLEG